MTEMSIFGAAPATDYTGQSHPNTPPVSAP